MNKTSVVDAIFVGGVRVVGALSSRARNPVKLKYTNCRGNGRWGRKRAKKRKRGVQGLNSLRQREGLRRKASRQ